MRKLFYGMSIVLVLLVAVPGQASAMMMKNPICPLLYHEDGGQLVPPVGQPKEGLGIVVYHPDWRDWAGWAGDGVCYG